MPTKLPFYLLFALYLASTAGFALHAAWRRPWLSRLSLGLVVAGVQLHSGLLLFSISVAAALVTGPLSHSTSIRFRSPGSPRTWSLFPSPER